MVQVQIGHEYELSGDGGTWVDGRLCKGVLLNEDGAFIGRIRNDGHGAWLDLMTEGDELIPAGEDWEAYIVREIPPISIPVRRAAA